jgi:hypothetical protein
VNIFYLDHDAVKCAEYHNDKHVVKMILEYAQLLSTAHRVLDGTISVRLSKTGRKQNWYHLGDSRDNVLYSATHINHPSAKWCRDSNDNYQWLYKLFCATCNEYTFRYGKTHLTDKKLRHVLAQSPKNISHDPFEAPWRAMPDEVKIGDDSLASYRNYYIKNKSHLANWKKRKVPDWYANL